ncbi:4Fe-4S dicluster domain-containing protein [Bacillus sp. HMF5848]|uniref:4Fe-4S dicluster domain-containing protein n=1 Tax=Bacillus sp. HMF5848 TaxID=2495421 RepID=UPI000F782636|nr:4Fe-4S dicluster domain-containing protein [Bacillus sp. HMF5848]RSK27555.1 4Fe-4S dicluster domain-containing protein [Bacillus sp. HMF5848]
MSHQGFLFNTNLCIGCLACVVACKNENSTHATVNWRRVTKLNDEHYISLSCNHCDSPECFRVCPENAFTKRKVDGIVEINSKLCSGCMICVDICPIGAPQSNPLTRKVTKCDFCIERQEQGLLPACIEACSTGALKLFSYDKKLPEHTTSTIEGFENILLTHPSIRFVSPDRKKTRYFLT